MTTIGPESKPKKRLRFPWSAKAPGTALCTVWPALDRTVNQILATIAKTAACFVVIDKTSPKCKIKEAASESVSALSRSDLEPMEHVDDRHIYLITKASVFELRERKRAIM